jgi:uncharacterized protein YndB with AHSA1/START domain
MNMENKPGKPIAKNNLSTQEPLRIERTFDAPVSKIWKALTDKEEMKKWYFDLKEFKAEPGFKFEFYGGDTKQYLHLCEVTEVIPLKKLTYSWKYEGYPGISYVSFELFEENGKTKLVLTHSGLETFPADVKDFERENFEEGWTQIIGNSLAKYLESEYRS